MFELISVETSAIRDTGVVSVIMISMSAIISENKNGNNVLGSKGEDEMVILARDKLNLSVDKPLTMENSTRQQCNEHDKVTECEDASVVKALEQCSEVVTDKGDSSCKLYLTKNGIGSWENEKGAESRHSDNVIEPMENKMGRESSQTQNRLPEKANDYHQGPQTRESEIDNELSLKDRENGQDIDISQMPYSPRQLQLVPYQQLSLVPVTGSQPISPPVVSKLSLSSPQQQPLSPLQQQLLSPPQHQPLSLPQQQPLSPLQHQPLSSPQQQPLSSPQQQPLLSPQQQPFIVPQHPQTVPTTQGFPYAYMQQPYVPMIYPYPQTAPCVENMQHQVPHAVITQNLPAVAPLQYPFPPMWPYYHPSHQINYAQTPTQHSYLPSPEAHMSPPSSTFLQQQDIPQVASQSQPIIQSLSTVMSPHIHEASVQHATQISGNAPQNVVTMQHPPTKEVLQQSQGGMQHHKANVSEGNVQSHPPSSVGVFPCINPHPSNENRSEVRLQGPHHLFTVVPVGSGDLKDSQVEKKQGVEEIKPLLSLASTKQPNISPLKNFRPTLPPIAPTPPVSPIAAAIPSFPSPRSVPSLNAVAEDNNNPSNGKNLRLTSPSGEGNGTVNSTPNLSAKSIALSPKKKTFSHYNTVIVSRAESTSKHNPYHTVAGSSPAYAKREFIRLGGLGPSPFHPRGEYGVGGLSLPTRRESGMKALPTNPYHTITGMISPMYSLREYGIGGRYSHFCDSNEECRGNPPALSQKEYGKGGGIPPSLAPLVLTRTKNSIAKAAQNSVKHLSWGYTVTTPHANNVKSISLRQLNTQIWPTFSTHADIDSTAKAESTTPLLQPSEQVTNDTASTQLVTSQENQENHQLTVQSMGGIEVGSTDGQYLTICGALTSPEQLPFLPSVFR
ncbi:hypothetical protein SK128_025015 [Halocaridina rubra]|uniref:Uncharacterized protein n=1 Tax=Halocaridina rubra TaxID=373956 RepID=A0AAN8WQU4_HALRR